MHLTDENAPSRRDTGSRDRSPSVRAGQSAPGVSLHGSRVWKPAKHGHVTLGHSLPLQVG